jgi:MFS family permease
MALAPRVASTDGDHSRPHEPGQHVGFGYALGGIVAGTFASSVSKRLGSGTCLALTLAGSVVVGLTIGLLPYWPVVIVMYTVMALLGTLWNVITVSLRQSIIPPHLLGRVNSVYRFFAWGMMPIGAAMSGGIVWFVDRFASRSWGLRSVYFVDAAIHLTLFLVGAAKLTTAKIDAARSAGTPSTS